MEDVLMRMNKVLKRYLSDHDVDGFIDVDGWIMISYMSADLWERNKFE